jgi:hypothetical protein
VGKSAVNEWPMMLAKVRFSVSNVVVELPVPVAGPV